LKFGRVATVYSVTRSMSWFACATVTPGFSRATTFM